MKGRIAMLKRIALIAALSFASPAFAATTSIQLDDLAAKIETATAVDHNNDIAAWNLLKEPVLTYAKRTINPNGAPNYGTSIDLASNDLRPPQPYWTFNLQELIAKPPVGNSSNKFYVSGFSYWKGCPENTYPDCGMPWESGGQSRVNRANAVMVAALRAWAYVLRQNGR
jgi:hypothetical protein